MRARARRVAITVLIMMVAGTALIFQSAGYSAALERFVGDFEVETPGWQQFEGLQYGEGRPIGESYALVETPVRQGRRAARVTARHGYSRFGYGESTLLLWNGGETEGQQYWYAWSTLFPREWTAPHEWGIFAQWHARLGTSPIIGFNAQGDRANFTLRSGLTDDKRNSSAVDRSVPLLSTLSKGRWNDFVLHVGWSTRNGFVDVYHRVEGSPTLRKVVSFRDVPTFQITKDGRGLGAYLLLGIYRKSFCAAPTRLGCTSSLGVQPPSMLYHDGFVRERTFEAAVSRAFPGPLPAFPPASHESRPTGGVEARRRPTSSRSTRAVSKPSGVAASAVSSRRPKSSSPGSRAVTTTATLQS